MTYYILAITSEGAWHFTDDGFKPTSYREREFETIEAAKKAAHDLKPNDFPHTGNTKNYVQLSIRDTHWDLPHIVISRSIFHCAHCLEPAVTNLDGENLCKTHADEWVRQEGYADSQGMEEVQ